MDAVSFAFPKSLSDFSDQNSVSRKQAIALVILADEFNDLPMIDCQRNTVKVGQVLGDCVIPVTGVPEEPFFVGFGFAGHR